MLAPRVPFPPEGGDRLRLYELLRHLGRRHQVRLMALFEGREPPTGAREALGRRAETVELFGVPRSVRLLRCAAAIPGSRRPLQTHYFHSGALARALRELPAGEVDVVLGSLVRTAPYALSLGLPAVVDVQDSVSLNYRRAMPHVGPRTRALYRLELPRLERYEREVAERADGISLISPVDLADLRLRARPRRAVVACNGVDPRRFAPAPEPAPTRDRVAFLGNLRTVANRDMVLQLAREVMPIVRRRRPRARLEVAGIEAPGEVRRLDDGHRVRIAGRVDDPAVLLRSAWLTVCPMRLGAGVPNKVLESMACGTPVVLTPMAADALALDDGDGVRIAEGAGDLAASIAELLADGEARTRLSLRARQVAVERFSWADALAPLERLLVEVAGGA